MVTPRGGVFTNTTLPERARIVIVGGGIIGASTLYHLAKEGIQDCVLLERDRFASGTTWHAAGLTTRIRDSRGQSGLVQYTSDLFRALEAETGQATGYRENGALYIATNPIRHELLKRQASASKHMGVRIDPLAPGKVKERWPLLHVDDVLGGVFIHGNGQVNPLDATMALIKGARQRGASAFEHTPVEDVLIRDGRAVGVRHPRGDIACDRVLLAGGLWSQRSQSAWEWRCRCTPRNTITSSRSPCRCSPARRPSSETPTSARTTRRMRANS